MNEKKVYIWKLADFLHQHDKKMSGQELVDHLKRNAFLTDAGTEFQGGRGVFKLIDATYDWLHKDLGLKEEADKVAAAYVNKDGAYAFDV